ncbi:MAG: glycoside hydrolase, partial [Actinomycetota bacterium]|nr:glycoside hydrolase [Actinomycetota bacterium]
MAVGPRLRQSELIRRAEAVLRGNDEGSFIKPGPRQYPGQWNWDAAFVTMGLAHIDAERGRREVRSLLAGQWADGMVPHIVFHAEDVDYFPGPSVWDSPSRPGAPPLPTSGITQPPALAGAVRLLHERSPDRPFLEEVVPRLDAWHRWLHRQRQFDGSGLVAIVHPWESGTDDSPRFLPALEALRLEEVPRFERRDRRHVVSSQRPTDLDYRRYVFLLDRLRRHGYRPASLREAPFAYLDASFNALLVAAEEDLGDLWEEIGQKGGEARARAEGMRAALGAQWDPETGLFRDRDLHGNDGSQETVAGLIPLYAGVPQPHQAARTARAMWDPA